MNAHLPLPDDIGKSLDHAVRLLGIRPGAALYTQALCGSCTSAMPQADSLSQLSAPETTGHADILARVLLGQSSFDFRCGRAEKRYRVSASFSPSSRDAAEESGWRAAQAAWDCAASSAGAAPGAAPQPPPPQSRPPEQQQVRQEQQSQHHEQQSHHHHHHHHHDGQQQQQQQGDGGDAGMQGAGTPSQPQALPAVAPAAVSGAGGGGGAGGCSPPWCACLGASCSPASAPLPPPRAASEPLCSPRFPFCMLSKLPGVLHWGASRNTLFQLLPSSYVASQLDATPEY